MSTIAQHAVFKHVSQSHQAVGASHVFPGRKAFLQEKIEYVQRKPVFSQVSTSSMC